MDLALTGKTALIVGGSRGIGRAIAASLAREGARVALVARGEEALRATVAALQAEGAEAHAIVADVATEAGAQAAVGRAIETLGGIPVLGTNVAGSLGWRPSRKAPRAQGAEGREGPDLNRMAAVGSSQAGVEWMQTHGGGAIVNVSSICGREYFATAPYMAAKAALIAMTKEMSVSLAKHHIRVNSVAPGSVMFPAGSWDRRAQIGPRRIA